MSLRAYIYLNVAVLALIAVAAHLDRIRLSSSPVYQLGIMCIYSLPVLPFVLLTILCFSNAAFQQKVYGGIVGACLWGAQCLAALPLVQ